MIRWKIATSVALVVLLLLPGVSNARRQIDALVGLKGVQVKVQKISPDAERMGLTEDQIKTDVELRLRKAGVRVLTEKEVDETPGQPALYVREDTIVMQDFPIIVNSISVELEEWVTLPRGSQPYVIIIIWSTSQTTPMGAGKIQQIRGQVGWLVDRFIHDYLAANPKK